MVSLDRIPMGRMVFSHGKSTIFDGICQESDGDFHGLC